MASENVEKILHTMKESPPLVLKLSLALARIVEAARIPRALTKSEKKELLVELSECFGDEGIGVAIIIT